MFLKNDNLIMFKFNSILLKTEIYRWICLKLKLEKDENFNLKVIYFKIMKMIGDEAVR